MDVRHVECLGHALRGELWPRAVTYSRKAGEKAFDRSANREAVAWWEQALIAIARLPQGEGVRAAIDVRLALRSALLQLGEIRRITGYLREAEQLASAAGSFDQFTATNTMSALAASSRVPALIVGPSSFTKLRSDSGPRLFAITAGMPARASARAIADPIAPAPMIPISMFVSPASIEIH